MWNGMATIAKCECMCACARARARYAREIRTLWQNVYPFLSLSLLTQSFILIVKLLLFLFVSPISADISQNRENWVKRSSRMNAQHQWMLWCYSDCYCFVCTNHKVRTEKSAQCKHTRTFVFSLFGMHTQWKSASWCDVKEKVLENSRIRCDSLASAMKAKYRILWAHSQQQYKKKKKKLKTKTKRIRTGNSQSHHHHLHLHPHCVVRLKRTYLLLCLVRAWVNQPSFGLHYKRNFSLHSFTLSDFHVVAVWYTTVHAVTVTVIRRVEVGVGVGVIVVRASMSLAAHFTPMYSIFFLFQPSFFILTFIMALLNHLSFSLVLLLVLLLLLQHNNYRITMCFSDLIHFHSEINASICWPRLGEDAVRVFISSCLLF